MGDLSGTLEQIAARVDALEQRVHALEHPAEEPAPLAVALTTLALPAQSAEEIAAQTGGAFPVLGKAMLGIAGAYLLRAVAESGAIPMLAIAAIAIVYAGLWLVWAARVPAGAWFAASTTYSCTSALILAPMLWELTVSFKVLSAAATASILCAFAAASSALAWKRNLASLSWVGNATAAAVAMALIATSRNLAPFAVALLLMALMAEFAEVRGHSSGGRIVVAAGADAGLLAMIFIYSSPRSARMDYVDLGASVPIALGCLLFMIYAAGVCIKTMLLRRRIAIFDLCQVMVAFALASAAVLYFGPETRQQLLGIVCLLLCAATYTAAFVLFGSGCDPLNRRVFATWSVALLLCGCWLCLAPPTMAACLGAAAIAATILGVRLRRQTLELHGMVYLIVAAAVSGLLTWCANTLALASPAAPTWVVCAVAACAALCYAAEQHAADEPWTLQWLHIAAALMATVAAAALLVSGLVRLVAFMVEPGVHHVALIRTLIACVAALALAFSGAHWGRKELTRIGYAILVLVAAKLLLEDMRHGHLAFITASIFVYAISLIAVPRLARLGQRVAQP